jgi:hypothetical protein
MTTPYRAKIRPTLTPAAQGLVQAYEATYGSSAPGCCPEALAAVLAHLAALDIGARELHRLAGELRGET